MKTTLCARFAGLGAALVLGACNASPGSTGGDASSSGGDAGATADGAPTCGRLTSLCPDGARCDGATDCVDGLCRDNTCQAASPADGVQDGDETDIDCGGSHAPACADGAHCLVPADCVDDVCTTGVCRAPTCSDGAKNGAETGVDCGGGACAPCADGGGCANGPRDCTSGVCTANACQAATCADGLKNGDETDVDCGGSCATKCATGAGCKTTADCDHLPCDTTTHTCAAPTSTDGLQNGTETDVDCGGGAPTNAPKCAVGQRCLAPGDCGSDGCDYTNHCVAVRSCAPHWGGDTCGAGETGTGMETHESCCASLPLPDDSVRIDKYEITAGRMREFIRRTNGDIQGFWNAFVAANPTSPAAGQIRAQDVALLPTGMDTPANVTYTHCDAKGQSCGPDTRNFGVHDYLGNTVFYPDRPCPNCGQGCWIGTAANGGYGHPTYWWDDATQTGLWGSQPRKFTKDTLDEKALNCAPQLLFAAFCAWDGGFLPTQAQLGGASGKANSAWGASAYPWGTTDPGGTMHTNDPGRMAYPYSTSNFFVPMNAGTENLSAPLYNVTNWNPFSPGLPNIRYAWPFVPSNSWDQTDMAYAIAAPGRFVNDRHATGAGALDGWFDVGANLIEVTATFTGNDDANHGSLPTMSWVGGSWEGHGVLNRSGYDLGILTKYGKQGARCARPF